MFSRLFNLDAPVWRVMSTVADIIWLNILTIVFSLPVVTIGASLTALHDSARRISASTDDGTTRTFVTSFTSNARKATALWGIAGPLAAAIGASWIFLRIPELLVLKILVTFSFVLIFPFIWSLQARLENSVRRTLANAVLVAFARLPWSVAVLAIEAVIVALFVAVGLYLPEALFLLVLLGLPLITFATTPVIERAIAPLVAQAVSGEHTAAEDAG